MVVNFLYGCAAFALFTVGILVIYVFAVLLPKIKATVARINEEVIPKVGNVIENLDGVTKSFQELSETEIKQMMNNIQNLTGQLNEEIPKIGTTIENVNGITGNVDGITASIQELSETEVKGIAGNIEEITSKINEDIAKVDEVVTTTTDFTKNTIEKAEFYRDKLFVPIVDILSFWNAIKTGLSSISQRKKDKEDEGGGDSNA
jgi:ABC-type transporter Mla subunit MlaD